MLAREVTKLVHGEAGLEAAQRITEALFSGNADQLSESDYEQLSQDGLPTTSLDLNNLADLPLTQLLSEADMGTGKQVKDALQRNAVIVNGEAQGLDAIAKSADVFAAEKARFNKYFLVKLGKKKHQLFTI